MIRNNQAVLLRHFFASPNNRYREIASISNLCRLVSATLCLYGQFFALLTVVITAASFDPCAAQQNSSGIEFFEKKIRPVFVEHCLMCHSSKLEKPMGGLRLDSQTGVLKGGESGPVLIPGDPEKSRLIQAILYKDPHLQMPPRGKLNDQQIEDFVAWVKMGAPDPRTGEARPADASLKPGIDFARARQFWSFRPLKQYPLPEVKNKLWPTSSIDYFVLAKLEAKGLSPSSPADRRTLIRRAYFDLIGLPPSPDEVRVFLADRSPHAFEKVVDRLLASPHYGERWGRHWLDLVRFAETDGHEFDVDKPNAWRYRDYVLRAFNNDLPYNRFLLEQLSGDLLPKDRIQAQEGYEEPSLGTGFYWLGEVINTPVDTFQALADRTDNQIDVFGKALLGLTVACARCHDHKFDPIPTTDYYGLAGFLQSSRLRQACIDSPQRVQEIQSLVQQIRQIKLEIENLQGMRQRPEPVRVSGPQYEIFDDFEGDSFGGWTVTGQAFGSVPVNGFASSGDVSDKLTGVMISKQFLIPKRYIHIRLAGNGVVRLVADEYTNKGRIVTGSDQFSWKTIDAQMGMGNLAYFEIVDQDRNGHIVVDVICFSDLKDPPPVTPIEPAQTEKPALSLDQQNRLADLVARRNELEGKIPPSTYGLATTDAEPKNTRVHIRGNHQNQGEEIPRRFLTVLSGETQPSVGDGSGRLELAKRMLGDGAPLLARVMVNRIWKQHFGNGIVASVDNFGLKGDPPSHPELLDHLASAFVEQGWSIKQMHREMVLSSTYQMSSHPDGKVEEMDPRNLLLHRMPIRRLEAEAIRDNVLMVSGAMDFKLYGPGVPPFVSPYMDGDPRGKPQSGPLDGNGRRSLYIQVRRNYLTDMFLTFDYPLPISTFGRRSVSTVASQALYMMNNEFVTRQSEKWAQRVLSEESDPSTRIEKMYLEAFARPPELSEKKEALNFIAKLEIRYQPLSPDAKEKAWTDLCHVLLNTTEFMYIR